MRWASFVFNCFVLPQLPPALTKDHSPAAIGEFSMHHTTTATSTTSGAAQHSNNLRSFILQEGISVWLSQASTSPSKADIQTLRDAFAAFYGLDRDLIKAEQLLSETIRVWQKNQPDDELAGLYRVRGDCYVLMRQSEKAVEDYTSAILLLSQKPGMDNADPAELPASFLGRARAVKSFQALGGDVSTSQALLAASDYEQSLKLTSREEWDTDEELLEDGASRNPFAAWEWGSMLRYAGKWNEAAQAHQLAAEGFSDIGDKARAVISLTDAGIDYAAANQLSQAQSVLSKAVETTKGIEGRDVALLQRVIAKEGEGRLALAALLWEEGQRIEAENTLTKACNRLDQLQIDAAGRGTQSLKEGTVNVPAGVQSSLDDAARLRYSIDDNISVLDMNCYKFKNQQFLSKQLGWPESLQSKVINLLTLK